MMVGALASCELVLYSFLLLIWLVNLTGSTCSKVDSESCVSNFEERSFIVQFWNYSSHDNLTNIFKNIQINFDNLTNLAFIVEPQLGQQVWSTKSIGSKQVWNAPLTDFIVIHKHLENTTSNNDTQVLLSLPLLDERIKRVFANTRLKQKLFTLDHKTSQRNFSTFSNFNSTASQLNPFPSTRSLLMRRGNSQDNNANSIPFDHKLFKLWKQGVTGKGMSIAVVDSGLDCSLFQSRFKNLQSCTDWTRNHRPHSWTQTLDNEFHREAFVDGVGHGTFVAGVVAGLSPVCGGVAPDVDLHVCYEHICF